MWLIKVLGAVKRSICRLNLLSLQHIPEGTYVLSEFFHIMIDKQALESFIEQRLEDTDYFLVSVSVSAQNEIRVEIDSTGRVDIDFCVELSRAIEDAFPRDDEDYELEVGSAGLTAPFKVPGQYEKNLGNRVEVLTRDGRKLRGILAEYDDNGFTIVTTVRVREEGSKRPVEMLVEYR